MKVKFIIFIVGLGILLFSWSCTKNFEDINTNPNNPDNAPLTNVFAYVIQDLSERSGTTQMEYSAAFVGHVTKGTYTEVTTYQGVPSPSVWDGNYGTAISDANFVINGADKEGNNNLKAAAMILKSYAIQMIVDIYGKVPYFEAGQGNEGLIHPAYDSEDVIYNNLLTKLDEANDLLVDDVSNGILGKGDLLYNGDILNWKKLCNSLHLRVAIRMSNVDETKASAEIAKILNDPAKYPIFESNSDNAFLSYPGDDWVEPWTARHSSIGDDWMAKPIVDILIEYADPRISVYAEPLADGTYTGLTVGDDADTVYSRVGNLFVENETGSVYFLRYSEVEFIKAEAAKRGFVGISAKDAYEAAITASCNEYGISGDEITTYLAGSQVSWADDLNQIYMQKWISLFRQSWEAWAEMRRTDVPLMGPAANSIYSGHNRPPFRFSYTDREQKLNGENIPTDVNEVDHYWGYQIWWDTRTGVH